MNAARTSFNPWPYVITGYFGIVIISIIMFVGWTMRNNVELVSKDYYEHEVLYQKQIDRVARTAETKSGAAIRYDRNGGRLLISISPAHAAKKPTGKIELYRPSDSRLDRTLPLKVDTVGKQTIDASQLREGFWRVRVSWTIGGEEFYSDSSVVIGSRS